MEQAVAVLEQAAPVRLVQGEDSEGLLKQLRGALQVAVRQL